MNVKTAKRNLKFTTHSEYFVQATPGAKERLEAVRDRVAALFPHATACISYNIPAFKTAKVFFFFAAFKKHMGIYPPVYGPAELVEELRPYRNEKGNLAFPFKEPMPVELIGRVAQALYAQYHDK